MSNIPKAREMLLDFAANGGLSPGQAMRVRAIVHQYMKSDKAVRRAPEKSAQITAVMKANIKRVAAWNPDMHVNEIAARFNVNPGRVSEILNGKR